MGIAQNLVNIGRPVAFHPGIKKIAKTTNATLFLCQLLYWSDKTDGWITKDVEDVRKETGLSYQEQRTARKVLLENNLIEEKFKRLSHNIDFRVKMDVVNEKWEKVQDLPLDEALKFSFDTEESEKVVAENKLQIESEKLESKKAVGQQIENPITHEIEILDKPFTHPSEYEKPQPKKEPPEKQKIKDAIMKKLGINPIGSKWEEFVNFAYDRHVNHNEPAYKFLNWAKNHKDFNPIYWTPQKMMILYPQAFITKKREQELSFDESFTPIEEPIVEEECVPMPDYFKPKYKLD